MILQIKEMARRIIARYQMKKLNRWADSFVGEFPSLEEGNHKNWRYKISCSEDLVEGPNVSNLSLQECALALLRAGNYVLEAKPQDMKDAVVTVNLFWPDFRSSDICVYFSRERFDWLFEPELPMPAGGSIS